MLQSLEKKWEQKLKTEVRHAVLLCRPRGCHPPRRASKTRSVIAACLSSVKIFAVGSNAGEGDDAAGGEKIGRRQRDCRQEKLQPLPLKYGKARTGGISNAGRSLLCIPGICRSCFFPHRSFEEAFQKHRWGGEAQSH